MTDVKEGAVIELVLNTQPLGNEDVEIRPHSLVIHSYKTPTFCDVCKEMLFGMFKQASRRKSPFYFCNPFLVFRASNASIAALIFTRSV